MTIFQQIQNFCGQQSEIEKTQQALKDYAGDNSPAVQVIKELRTIANGEQSRPRQAAQIIGKLPGAENLSSEFRNQVSALQERARLQRQIQSLGFPDFETLHYQIADYQARMERKEMLKAKREEIRNAKFKPIVPNITIEIHLYEKEDEGE